MDIKDKHRAHSLIQKIISGDEETFPFEPACEFVSLVSTFIVASEFKGTSWQISEVRDGFTKSGQVLVHEDVFGDYDGTTPLEDLSAFRLLHFNARSGLSAYVFMFRMHAVGTHPEFSTHYALEYILDKNEKVPLLLRASFAKPSFTDLGGFGNASSDMTFRPWKLSDVVDKYSSLKLEDFE